ncbi:MAG: chorismate synthase [Crocinitomicaceae bacterium]|nr:chorismate synthase [Crocinitomicaceae bacterium]
MSRNSFGTLFCLTTFGESHGAAIGGVVDGCPAGLTVDVSYIQKELSRRRPGQSDLTTQRKENDTIEILSGIFENKSTGAPIAFLLRNEDHRPKDYDELRNVYRPGHADFTWEKKYGIRDHRGGGRSSARETAARVAGGAIAKLFLMEKDIAIKAYISGIKNIHVPLPYTQLDLSAEENEVRCPHKETSDRMRQLIEKTKENGDSVGGIITCVITGVKSGWGEPVFDKLHAMFGHAMLSINACKSFEIGDGLSSTLRLGSENNDTIGQKEKETNHDGGIQGGISNGRDIWFRVGFKPPSTISIPQHTTDIEGNEIVLEAKGRHDPCVLPRAVPVVEAMAALVLADAYLLSTTNRL